MLIKIIITLLLNQTVPFLDVPIKQELIAQGKRGPTDNNITDFPHTTITGDWNSFTKYPECKVKWGEAPLGITKDIFVQKQVELNWTNDTALIIDNKPRYSGYTCPKHGKLYNSGFYTTEVIIFYFGKEEKRPVCMKCFKEKINKMFPVLIKEKE